MNPRYDSITSDISVTAYFGVLYSTTEIEKSEIILYPNPASDKTIIQTELIKYEIEIINVFGKILYKGENKKEINLEKFSPGAYILRIIREDNTL